MTTESMAPGFADPVLDAQRVFRAVLNAMARPGTITQIRMPTTPPAPVDPAAGAVLLSLADHETPVWIDSGDRVPGFAEWLGFHCGSRLVTDPMQATFALVTAGATMPPLTAFEPGSEEYPDGSATVIVQVPSLTGGSAWTLTGPGIRDRIDFAPSGLPAASKDWIVENNARFPQGVDLMFTRGNHLVGLPRSTRLKG